MNKVILKLIPFYWLIILLFIGATALSLPRAIKLLTKIDTSISSLLPDDTPTIKVKNEIEQTIKRDRGGDLIVLLSSPDSVANQKAYIDLVRHLETHPDIKTVEHLRKGYEFFENHRLLYMELDDIREIKRRVKRKIGQEKLGGLFIDLESDGDEFQFDDLAQKYRVELKEGVESPYLTNSDQTVFALWIHPHSTDMSMGFFKQFFKKMDTHIQAFDLASYGQDIELYYAGSIRTRLNEYESLMSDLKKAGLVSLSGIFLLLLFYFKRVVAVILLFVPLISGVSFGFAICSFFIGAMNLVTSFLFSILFGLGVDIGIHLLSRYRDERAEGKSQQQALMMVITKTGRSSSLAAMTTVMTFLILIFNDFRGFSEFGMIAGLGLFLTLVTYLLFFPALILAVEKLKILDFAAIGKPRFNQFQQFPRPHLVFKTGLVLLIVFVFLIPFVQFEWNSSVLKSNIPKTQIAREKLKTVSSRVNWPAVFLIENQAQSQFLKAELEKRKTQDKDSPTIDYYRSSYDLYPHNQDAKLKVLKEIDQLFEDDALKLVSQATQKNIDDFRAEIAKTKTFKPQDIPWEIQSKFYGQDKNSPTQMAFVFPLPDLELDDGRHAIAFSNDIKDLTFKGQNFQATSNALVFADVLTVMFHDSRTAILLSLLTLSLLVYFDFRSIKRVGMIMASLSFGVLGMAAMVVLGGLKFNFFNMVTIPVVLGMGVDSSVHLYHRFLEEGGASVMKALQSSGVAALFSSLTTIMGYSGLLFAHHPGLKSIGLFAIIGMSTCLVGSLVFLPSALAKKV